MVLNVYQQNYVKEKERNAVFIGFSEQEKKRNTFMSGKDYIISEREAVFPRIYYYDFIDEVKRLHGYCVYIKVDYDYNYIKDNFINLDKFYRKKFKNFKVIVLYSEKFFENAYFDFGKFSNLRIVDKDVFFDSAYNYFDNIFEEYRSYCIEFRKIKVSKLKMQKLDIIRKLLKDKKEISTNDINEMTGISIRNVQRYMHDINRLYNEIGYDELKNVWYKV